MPIGKREKLLDKVFRDFIRMRAISRVHGCEKCLQGKTSYKELHCAHYHRRQQIRLRWDEDNAAGLCPGCHMFIDDEAPAKVEFFKELLGETKFLLLEVDQGKPDVEMLILYYKKQIEELKNEL